MKIYISHDTFVYWVTVEYNGISKFAAIFSKSLIGIAVNNLIKEILGELNEQV